MINEVRNTVLSILAKDNRGYITPFEFNLFAKQAQLDVFERYIYLYSNAIIKQNARAHGEGYADVPKKLAEVMDTFYVINPLNYTSPYWEAPTDSYFIQKLVWDDNLEIEKVSHQKALYLLASNLTAPTEAYPVYTMSDDYFNDTPAKTNFTVYPDTITSKVSAHYIRYPKEPKWTYVAMGPNDSDPLFNPSALDYQDFEMPMSDFSDLVVKILQYAGVSIREQEVMAAAKAEEIQEIQQKQ
jgi:hypothetical protein